MPRRADRMAITRCSASPGRAGTIQPSASALGGVEESTKSRRDGTKPSTKQMITRVLLFTQPGCLSCELMKIFLEARAIAFEERDITADVAARRIMTDQYDSVETPTMVICFGETEEVIVGFDPVRLDQFLDAAPSSDSVTES